MEIRSLRELQHEIGCKYVLITHSSTIVRGCDLSTAKVIAIIKGHREQAVPSSFSSDGLRLLTSSTDGTAKLWDTKTGRELLNFKVPIGKHSHPKFSPDGKRVLIVRDGVVDILTSEESKDK